MTRNRTTKQTNRRRATAASTSYMLARQQRQKPLFEDFDEHDDDFACCTVLDDMAAELHERLDREGASALTAEFRRLAQTMLSRDSHYTDGSSHGVLMTAQAVCLPLLCRTGIKSSAGAEIVWREPVLLGADHVLVSAALGALEDAAYRAWVANAPY